MKYFLLILTVALFAAACGCGGDSKKQTKGEEMKANVSQISINKTIGILKQKYGEENAFRIERGVKQAASLWRESDGSEKDFVEYAEKNFVVDPDKLDQIFDRLSTNFEILFGHMNKITLDLNRPLHLSGGDILPVDYAFGAYDPSAHFDEDFYKNKIAIFVALNFPFYTLEEKQKLADDWSRKDWAYARMGDLFTSRVPAVLKQEISRVMTDADAYISEYNIFMGKLVDDEMKTYFPEDMKLISHWNLRDELKSQYAKPEGFYKQKMIYEVMLSIINQDIPEKVINSNEYEWNPFTNAVYKDGEKVDLAPEPDTRYKHLLANFNARKAVDKFSPQYPTYIERKFSEEMEIPQETVEKLFVDFISSPQAKQVAELIEKRLGRKLEPFDIWYDGFKARSGISEDELTAKTRAKYPDTEAFDRGIPDLLVKLGFSSDKANNIGSKIDVDPARGAGHAWGAQMKSENAHLRTRIPKEGMDYKGYNIAIHELGHNVEQTLTLRDVDYYLLNGVPNTAFTEAWAFLFQKRDLALLSVEETAPNKEHLQALDNFWSTYEIMGVSLVDQYVWQKLYDNPNMSAAELKKTVIETAVEVWNKYYAPVFGVEDSPILAIYSHMIDYPLYLSAYPIGHLIEFQIDEYIAGKNLATEMQRMCVQGRIIPKAWMIGAVDREISIEPTLNATQAALDAME